MNLGFHCCWVFCYGSLSLSVLKQCKRSVAWPGLSRVDGTGLEPPHRQLLCLFAVLLCFVAIHQAYVPLLCGIEVSIGTYNFGSNSNGQLMNGSRQQSGPCPDWFCFIGTFCTIPIFQNFDTFLNVQFHKCLYCFYAMIDFDDHHLYFCFCSKDFLALQL